VKSVTHVPEHLLPMSPVHTPSRGEIDSRPPLALPSPFRLVLQLHYW
jgi:hypothetical protein